jgi:hypothetical protein
VIRGKAFFKRREYFPHLIEDETIFCQLEQHHTKTTMGIDLYPSMLHVGDLSPGMFGSDVDEICEEIEAACKGFGTNEE